LTLAAKNLTAGYKIRFRKADLMTMMTVIIAVTPWSARTRRRGTFLSARLSIDGI